MGKPGNTGVVRIFRAARYSAQGIAQAWRHEAAFRQEVGLTLVMSPLGLWLGSNPLERVLLIGSCVLVLVVELLNSAIEAAIDRHGDEFNELSGRAKDLGSAAVMLSLGVVAAIWIVVAWQRFGSSV